MRLRIAQSTLKQAFVSRQAARLQCAQSPCPRFATRGFSTTLARREDAPERKWSTPLAKQLYDAISITGPIPLASYMRMCLTGDVGGYYTGAIAADTAPGADTLRDQFGKKGDFITSPEISQVFGELLGVWFIAEWMSQGRPAQGVQIIEVGPGRGTLMDDMLRTIQRFPAMANSIEHIYMVEASKELQTTQKKLLCSEDASSRESEVGSECVSKYGGKPITWTNSIKSIPIDPRKTPFIVAHELFDALPIHAFQTATAAPKPKPSQDKPQARRSEATASPASSTSEAPETPSLEWREMMVAPVQPSSAEPSPSPEFQLILSPGTTRHSRFLPQISQRYDSLSKIPSAIIEVCPDASIYATDFAHRIGGTSAQPKPKPSGAALILDYGTATSVPANSLRGIRAHKLVNPFLDPGLVDLSADVDFTAIADIALMASEGIEVHGPVEQADFLEVMGIRERASALVKKSKDEETKERMDTAWKRLVDRGPEGMGKVYKALAIVPENGGRRRPVGFGGDIGM